MKKTLWSMLALFSFLSVASLSIAASNPGAAAPLAAASGANKAVRESQGMSTESLPAYAEDAASTANYAE